MAKSTPHSESIFGTEPRYIPKKEEGNLLYYILMAMIVLGSSVGIVLVSGMFRLTLALLIIFVIGFNLVYWVVEETDDTEIWEREDELNEEINLKLKETSELVQRAFRGMELSQGVLEKKIENLFLEKLKENRNLSEEEVRELVRDQEKFRQVVDDELISDFILSKKDEDFSSERLERENYKRLISTLLKRIEKW